MSFVLLSVSLQFSSFTLFLPSMTTPSEVFAFRSASLTLMSAVEYFMSNPGQVLSREQIYDRVWGMDSESGSNNLEAYLSFLRRKLRAAGSRVNIKAVRGLGYRLEIKDEETEK